MALPPLPLCLDEEEADVDVDVDADGNDDVWMDNECVLVRLNVICISQRYAVPEEQTVAIRIKFPPVTPPFPF